VSFEQERLPEDAFLDDTRGNRNAEHTHSRRVGWDMMEKNSSPWAFILAFREQWFAAMSGGVSVPFAALAAFTDDKWAQIIFGVLAFTAVWFAAYRIWKVEHEKSLALSELMKPKLKFLKLNRDPKDSGFEIEIQNTGGEHLNNCLVKIENAAVTKGSAISSAHLPMTLLTRGQADRGDSGSFNLRPGEVKPISFIYQANMPSGWAALDYEGGSRIFHNVKQCTFTVVAFGPPTPARTNIIVELNEDRKLTAEILPNA
jgi:hypothetical protein